LKRGSPGKRSAESKGPEGKGGKESLGADPKSLRSQGKGRLSRRGIAENSFTVKKARKGGDRTKKFTGR